MKTTTKWYDPQTIIKKNNTAKLVKKAFAVALTGTLVFAGCPAIALAEQSSGQSQAAQSSKPDAQADSTKGTPPDGEGGSSMGEPPDGEGGGSGAPGQGGPGGGANTTTFDYSGTYSGAITADGEEVLASSETYEATETDQNAALTQNGGTLTLSDVVLQKSGDDTNGDNCNFYGVNSILTAVGENSLATICNSALNATSEGSNAIFATNGATVYAWDSTITTSAGNSRGLDATYGGTIVAANMDITTEGGHCATVATDRGGGYISLADSTLETNGDGSPLLYSTGDIEVNNVEGTATESQIAGMEGLNTILIKNSTLESTNEDKTGSDPVANGVIIYQSTSGDAETTTGETATFQAANSTLKSAITSGSMFYLTNTSAEIVLSNTQLDFDSDAVNLLLAAGNDSNNWGSAGSNGATVKFTAIGEDLAGTIEADTISSVDAYLTDNTSWTGAAVISQNSAGSTSEEPLNINIDSTSTWVVTQDSTVSNLCVAEGGKVVDNEGKTVTIIADGTTVVEGDSALTVTIEGGYSTSYDASEAGTLTSDVIDRTAFDETSGLSTVWSMGDTSASSTTTTTTAASTASSTEAEETESTQEVGFFEGVFAVIRNFFASLFGGK